MKSKHLKVGGVYWVIRLGWGEEDIVQAELLERRYDKTCGVYYNSRDVGEGARAGSCGIGENYIFRSKEEAETYRDGMAAERVKEEIAKTDTPQKMLNYLLDQLTCRECLSYSDHKVNQDIRNRAQEMFFKK